MWVLFVHLFRDTSISSQLIVHLTEIAQSNFNVIFILKKWIIFLAGKKRIVAIEFAERSEEISIGPNLELSVTLRPFKALDDNGNEGFGILHLGKR